MARNLRDGWEKGDMRQKEDWQKFYEAHVATIMRTLQYAITAITVVAAFVTVATFTSIKELKDQYKADYEEISKNANEAALNKAKELVIEKFETQEMQDYISKVASDSLKKISKLYFDRSTSILNDEILKLITTSVEISLSIDDIRFNDRKGISNLEKEINFPKNKQSGILAKVALDKKGRDYENYLLEKGINDDSKAYITLPFGHTNSQRGIDYFVSNLVDTIKLSQNLYNVSEAFSAVRKLTNKEFKMFDTKSIQDWYKNTYPKTKTQLQNKLEELLPK